MRDRREGGVKVLAKLKSPIQAQTIPIDTKRLTPSYKSLTANFKLSKVVNQNQNLQKEPYNGGAYHSVNTEQY